MARKQSPRPDPVVEAQSRWLEGQRQAPFSAEEKKRIADELESALKQAESLRGFPLPEGGGEPCPIFSPSAYRATPAGRKDPVPSDASMGPVDE